MALPNLVMTFFAAPVSLVSIACGVGKLINHQTSVDSIRDAMYASVSQVNPEIIQQANELISQTNLRPDYIMGLTLIATGGLCAVGTYFNAKAGLKG